MFDFQYCLREEIKSQKFPVPVDPSCQRGILLSCQSEFFFEIEEGGQGVGAEKEQKSKEKQKF